MSTRKVYHEIAAAIEIAERNQEYSMFALRYIEKNLLPSGSGFDSGTTIDSASSKNRIVLFAPFHCMNENGYYDGWIDYRVVVKPDLQYDIDVKIYGRDYRGTDLRSCVLETICNALNTDVEQYSIWDAYQEELKKCAN